MWRFNVEKGTTELLLQWLAIFVAAKLKSRKFKPLLFLCTATLTAWTLSWGGLVQFPGSRCFRNVVPNLLVFFDLTWKEHNSSKRLSPEMKPLRSTREVAENVAFSLGWKTQLWVCHARLFLLYSSELLFSIPRRAFWTTPKEIPNPSTISVIRNTRSTSTMWTQSVVCSIVMETSLARRSHRSSNSLVYFRIV